MRILCTMDKLQRAIHSMLCMVKTILDYPMKNPAIQCNCYSTGAAVFSYIIVPVLHRAKVEVNLFCGCSGFADYLLSRFDGVQTP